MRSVPDSRGFFYSFNVHSEGRVPLLRASRSTVWLAGLANIRHSALALFEIEQFAPISAYGRR